MTNPLAQIENALRGVIGAVVAASHGELDDEIRDALAKGAAEQIVFDLGLTYHGEGFTAPNPTEFWHCWATPWVRTCTCRWEEDKDGFGVVIGRDECPIHKGRE